MTFGWCPFSLLKMGNGGIYLSLVVSSNCMRESALVNLSPTMVKGFSDMSVAEIEQIQRRGRWTGNKAAQMYEGPALISREKAYPTHAKMVCGKKRHRSWSVLEENDPTGYKSTAGKDAKKQVGIDIFELPPRSPDLNVLDDSLWAEVSGVFASKSASSHAIR